MKFTGADTVPDMVNKGHSWIDSKLAKRFQKNVTLEHTGTDTVTDTRQELKYPPTREVMTTPRRAPKEGSAKGGQV